MGGAVVRLFQATMGHPQPSKIIVGAVRDRGMCCLAGGGAENGRDGVQLKLSRYPCEALPTHPGWERPPLG